MTPCGNGAVDEYESCDDSAGIPCVCDDGDACTDDRPTSGAPETCDLLCEHVDISGDEDVPDDDFDDELGDDWLEPLEP